MRRLHSIFAKLHSLIAASRSEPAAQQTMRLTVGVALGALAVAATLTAMSYMFGYDTEVEDMPALWLVALLAGAGAVFALVTPNLVAAASRQPGDVQRRLFILIITAGLLARLILFASVPALEDDYNRYLWDGAVVAHGISPYVHSPLAVYEARAPELLVELGRNSDGVLEKINHKSLTTIYPPVAQAAFAMSYVVKPFDLTAWRGLLLAADLVTLLCLLWLLDSVGRSRLWVALYWLNPVVLKEVFNSGHMEGILLPLVLSTLLLAARRRPLLATVSLAFATGIKFWPILLAPVIWRSLRINLFQLFLAIVILGSLTALWLAPMLLAGSNDEPGLIAYVDRWTTNSALFPALEAAVRRLQDWLGLRQFEAGLVARGIVGLALAVISIAIAWKPVEGTPDLVLRSSIVVASIVLLSPAQYPWYTVWFAPFLVFHPYRAFLVLTALIPMYYAKFYLVSHDQGAIFYNIVVWMIWGPVLVLALAGIRANYSSWKSGRRFAHGL